MNFSTVISLISSPITVLSLVIVGGILIGRIKIFGISLGVAATLMASIGIGCLLSFFNIMQNMDVLRVISSFASSLFVASIGISAGNKKLDKSLLKIIFCCIAVVVLVFFVMKFIQKAETQLHYSTIAGVLCGALTSSPGFASALNNNCNDAALTTAGYGAAYTVGLFLVVLFVQVFSKNPTINAPSKPKEQKHTDLSVFLCQVFTAIAVGHMVGGISLPLVNVNIGHTGGVLIASLIVGFLCASKKKDILGYEKTIKNLGLSLFLSCNGLLCGMSILSAFSLRFLLYSSFFALFTILISYACARCFLHFTHSQALIYVCGVMTSTPAFSAITEGNNSNEQISIFTTAYSSSLVTFVLLMGIM